MLAGLLGLVSSELVDLNLAGRCALRRLEYLTNCWSNSSTLTSSLSDVYVGYLTPLDETSQAYRKQK